jgi:MoxR-like ATPase
VELVSATRTPAAYGLPDLQRHLSFGASPRATLALVEGARAFAFLRGRSYAMPQDLLDIAADVLRHRLVLSYEALAEGLRPDDLIAQLLQAVPAPQAALHHHVQVAANPAS